MNKQKLQYSSSLSWGKGGGGIRTNLFMFQRKLSNYEISVYTVTYLYISLLNIADTFFKIYSINLKINQFVSNSRNTYGQHGQASSFAFHYTYIKVFTCKELHRAFLMIFAGFMYLHCILSSVSAIRGVYI